MSWTRGDKLALLGLLVAIIVGVLAIPQDSWVRSFFQSTPSPAVDKPETNSQGAGTSSERPSVVVRAPWTPSNDIEIALARDLALLDAVSETCRSVSPQLVGATEMSFREKLNAHYLAGLPQIRESQVYRETYETQLRAAKAQMHDLRDCQRMLNLASIGPPYR